MKPAWTAAALLVAFSSAPAAAQLESERVEGAQRVCVYREVEPGRVNERRIGLAEACSAYYRPLASNFPAPPTARLDSVRVRGDKRVCSYVQLNGRWAFEVPITRQCPPSAGMIATGPDAR